MSGLVGGRHHHSVADGESDEEVDDVGEVGGQLGHGLAVEAHEVHLTAAFIDFVQELRVGGDIFLLQDRTELIIVAAPCAHGGAARRRSRTMGLLKAVCLDRMLARLASALLPVLRWDFVLCERSTTRALW